ncbi:MAG: hypothetical protein ACLUD2_15655 [Clostridium sp.]
MLGLVTDEVIDAGGTAILSETVECIERSIFCVRTEELRKSENRFTRQFLTGNRNDYMRNQGEDAVWGNPSPGNDTAGGITTLTEKSLGCIHKVSSGTL